MDNGELTFPHSTAECDASGLTKREWFAGLAMQGLSAIPDNVSVASEKIAAWAVQQADALIAELAK